MNKLITILKNYWFTIFVILLLGVAIIIVIQFNSIVNDSINATNTTPTNSSAPLNAGSGVSSPSQNSPTTFDEATANRLREMKPAAEVGAPPALNLSGRTNPFVN